MNAEQDACAGEGAGSSPSRRSLGRARASPRAPSTVRAPPLHVAPGLACSVPSAGSAQPGPEPAALHSGPSHRQKTHEPAVPAWFLYSPLRCLRPGHGENLFSFALPGMQSGTSTWPWWRKSRARFCWLSPRHASSCPRCTWEITLPAGREPGVSEQVSQTPAALPCAAPGLLSPVSPPPHLPRLFLLPLGCFADLRPSPELLS